MADARLQSWVKRNLWNFEKRTVYDLFGTAHREATFGNFDNFSNEVVTPRRAIQLATVYSCINVRAQTIASLPINVIRESKGEKEVIVDHPAYYPLAHEPNDYMTSANMFLTSMIHSDMDGNSVIGINRDGKLRPTSFDLIMPEDWNVSVEKGQAFYKIRGEMYPSRDVLHFRWFSLDGLIGVSPIRQNQLLFGRAFKSERYGSQNMGSVPPGFLTYEGELRPEQRAQSQKSWEEDRYSGKTPTLSGRWDYKTTMVNPKDMEYIQQMDMTDQQIASIFRVPPVLLQNYQRATWKNAEESDLIFAKHTITPIIRVMEQEMNMKLFTEREKANYYVKFNLNGLLRGDIAARQAFYQSMVNTGVMNRNEARSLEDMNPYKGGDEFLIQGAMILADPDLLRKRMEKEVIPSAPAEPKTKVNGHAILN